MPSSLAKLTEGQKLYLATCRADFNPVGISIDMLFVRWPELEKAYGRTGYYKWLTESGYGFDLVKSLRAEKAAQAGELPLAQAPDRIRALVEVATALLSRVRIDLAREKGRPNLLQVKELRETMGDIREEMESHYGTAAGKEVPILDRLLRGIEQLKKTSPAVAAELDAEPTN